MMIFLIIILALFFTINMGGASFAASFAVAYGSKITSMIKAGLLFIFFVALGAILFGKNVSMTLGHEIMPSSLIDTKAIIIIFLSAGLSMFIANMMNIPQSTSLVTVAAIAGVGAHYGQVNLKTIYFLIPFWIVLPILSFIIARYLAGLIYPPRRENFWFYEKFVNHQKKLKRFVVLTSCYSAFSVGTNNVANVVGPMIAIGYLPLVMALFVFSLVYGVGAFVFTGPLKTAGDKFVPLGLVTASIISLVSGTLMIMASVLGVPQSFVMLQMGAIIAISMVKHGKETTFSNPLTKKTFYTWSINPLLTFVMSFVIASIVLE